MQTFWVPRSSWHWATHTRHIHPLKLCKYILDYFLCVIIHKSIVVVLHLTPCWPSFFLIGPWLLSGFSKTRCGLATMQGTGRPNISLAINFRDSISFPLYSGKRKGGRSRAWLSRSSPMLLISLANGSRAASSLLRKRSLSFLCAKSMAYLKQRCSVEFNWASTQSSLLIHPVCDSLHFIVVCTNLSSLG
jgi:hypothetical protein